MGPKIEDSIWHASSLRASGLRPGRARLASGHSSPGGRPMISRHPGQPADEHGGRLSTTARWARPGRAVAQLAVGVDGRQALVDQPHRDWREPGRQRGRVAASPSAAGPHDRTATRRPTTTSSTSRSRTTASIATWSAPVDRSRTRVRIGVARTPPGCWRRVDADTAHVNPQPDPCPHPSAPRRHELTHACSTLAALHRHWSRRHRLPEPHHPCAATPPRTWAAT